MFQDAEHTLESSVEQPEKTLRKGHYKGRKDRWAEINWRAVGPSIGYAHVPHKPAAEFNNALNSFHLP
jgi:hypothetical protein